MRNFIIFSNSYRLGGVVEKIYSEVPKLKQLDTDLLISLDFPSGSKVHFAHDGNQLFDNQKNDLYQKIAQLDHKGKFYVCLHKSGDKGIQNGAINKLQKASLFTVEFSHNEGLYKDLNSWYKGEIGVENLLKNHFFISIKKYRDNIIEHLFIGKVPDDFYIVKAQMNQEQKEMYENISKNIGRLSNSKLEEFNNLLKNIEI